MGIARHNSCRHASLQGCLFFQFYHCFQKRSTVCIHFGIMVWGRKTPGYTEQKRFFVIIKVPHLVNLWDCSVTADVEPNDEITDEVGDSSFLYNKPWTLRKSSPYVPYGKIVNVEVVDGGLICSSGVHVEEMDDKNDDCNVVNAAVYVGY
ncbi:50S ribosomal protein L34 [Quillaja saponaria]|uniref:50S ribosomal protein L34 n=1 Tax=Quillaja saponaria TaxID=32244 RepID=A0AAD7KWU7_QUISA|nr:50S ribosomal protein L34 [Quillaja saponaria]